MQLNSLLDNIANFTKKRLIEFLGLILVLFFFIFTFTLVTYSPENTTLIYKADGSNIDNIFFSNINEP